jgi:uncharacterized protein
VTSTRAAELISKLGLQPHPEGGWYREIYRSATRIQAPRGSRSALTTIYYLLEQSQLSRWHVVQADELWHFYAGAPLELVAYAPGSREVTRHVLGRVAADEPGGGGRGAEASGGATRSAGRGAGGGGHGTGGGGQGADAGGATSVAVIPAGIWQAARSLGEYTLAGCTVGPGFEFADFQFVSELPSHRDHFTGGLAAFADLL